MRSRLGKLESYGYSMFSAKWYTEAGAAPVSITLGGQDDAQHVGVRWSCAKVTEHHDVDNMVCRFVSIAAVGAEEVADHCMQLQNVPVGKHVSHFVHEVVRFRRKSPWLNVLLGSKASFLLEFPKCETECMSLASSTDRIMVQFLRLA